LAKYVHVEAIARAIRNQSITTAYTMAHTYPQKLGSSNATTKAQEEHYKTDIEIVRERRYTERRYTHGQSKRETRERRYTHTERQYKKRGEAKKKNAKTKIDKRVCE
jgi:hypothetical protein